jgi:translation initiation factor eIF-2B subunit delta
VDEMATETGGVRNGTQPQARESTVSAQTEPSNPQKQSVAELKAKAKAEKAARRAQAVAAKAAATAAGTAPGVGTAQGGQPGGDSKGGKSAGKPRQEGPQTPGSQPPNRASLPRRPSTLGRRPSIAAAEKEARSIIPECFSHIPMARGIETSQAHKDVHPAVLALGQQMATFTMRDSTARLKGTLLAFRKVKFLGTRFLPGRRP